jgi:hypothetical protein
MFFAVISVISGNTKNTEESNHELTALNPAFCPSLW